MKKFKDGIKEKDVIVKCGTDKLLPFALTFGLYIILFGTVSPGGGFQGGVVVASAVLLIYLGYGFAQVAKSISMNVLRVNEAIGAIAYVAFGMIGLFAGYNFCTNIFFNNGRVGDLISAGTITFMSYSVGYKVMMGVGLLLMLLLSQLNDEGDEDAYVAEEDEH